MNPLFHCSIQDEFEKMWNVLSIYRHDIERVKADLELLEEGWRMHFAIDFYQLYKFLHPQEEPSRDGFEQEVWMRAAGAFIFSGEKGALILLPPYILELRNYITHLMEIVRKIEEKFQYKDLLEESDRKKLEEARKIYSEGGTLPENLMNELIDLINIKFPNIYKLISGGFRNEIAKIDELFKKKRILAATVYWDKDRDVLNLIQEEEQKSLRDSRWYSSFWELRPQVNHITNNLNDAKAIQIIMALNNYFREKNRKEVVYLISDARTMDKVLNWDNYDEINWIENNHPLGIIKDLGEHRNIRILRTSKSFLTYLLGRGTSENGQEERREIIENLTTWQKEIYRLTSIHVMIREEFSLCVEKCNNPGKELQCLLIQEKIKKLEEEYKKTTLFKLISQSRQLFEPYIGKFAEEYNKNEKNIEDMKNLIDFLMLEKVDFEKKIKQEIEKLDAGVNEALLKLRKDVVMVLSLESLKRMTYKLRRLRGIPYRIKFENPTTKESLREFFHLMDECSREPYTRNEEKSFRIVQKKWERLLRLADDESLGLESKLLLAVIFFCYRFYDYVISIKSEIESSLVENPEIEKEFLLLECLANYRLYRTRNLDKYLGIAKSTCDRCVMNYYNDPRFLYLSAILNFASDSKIEAIEDSLSLLNNAKKISETYPEWSDNYLRSTILHGIAFMTLKKEDIDLHTVQTIEGLLRRIEELIPREEWDPEIWDTEALLFLKKSEFIFSLEEKKEMLKKSAISFEEGLKMAESLDLDNYRRESIKRDLDSVISEFPEIGSSAQELEEIKKIRDRSRKGKILENFVVNMLKGVDGFSVNEEEDINLRLHDGEIDILVRNESTDPLFMFLGTPVLVEVKNWDKPAGKNVVVSFIDKLRERGIKTGILVAYAGLTGNKERYASHKILDAKKENITVILLTCDDLRKLYQDLRPNQVIKDAFYRTFKH